MSKSTGTKQIVKNEAEKEEKMTLTRLAMVLTILDQKIHEGQYFQNLREVEDAYIKELKIVQEIFANQILDEHVLGLLGNNKHLLHLFQEREILKIVASDS